MPEYTFDEALEKLGLEKDKLREYVKEGKLKAFAKNVDGKKKVVFKEDEVLNLQKEVNGDSASPELDDAGDLDLDLGGDDDVVLDDSPADDAGDLDLDLGDDSGDNAGDLDLDLGGDDDAADADSDDITLDLGDDSADDAGDLDLNLGGDDDAADADSDDITLDLGDDSGDDAGDLDLDLGGDDGASADSDDLSFDLPDAGEGEGSDDISFDIDDGDLGGDETISLDGDETLSLEGGDETISLDGDETLSLEGGDDTLSLSSDETLEIGDDGDSTMTEQGLAKSSKRMTRSGRFSSSQPAVEGGGPVTKIVNEPSLNIAFPFLAVMSFLLMLFIGFLSWGSVGVANVNKQGTSFDPESPYTKMYDWVKDNMYFPLK